MSVADVRRPRLGKLGGGRRQGVSLAGAELVRTRPLHNDGPLPLLAEPAIPGVDLAAWLTAERARVNELLTVNGGILFRGFEVGDMATFEGLVRAVSGELLDYTYRSTPRKQVEGRIFTSTEYPPDQFIPMHNEMSYAAQWPMKIWFWCVEPAASGGVTPIADSRAVYRRIDPALRDEFEARGVLYVRNYGDGIDLPWSEVFQTSDRDEVETYCRGAGIRLEWRGNGSLHTRQRCQATAVHPGTGERVWFNQAHLFHVSSLAPEVRESMLAALGEDRLPRDARFGDGEPIPTAALDHVRAAYRAENVFSAWQRDDVLLLDNMLVAHGRAPFSGRRRVLVGMAEPQDAPASASTGGVT